MQTYCKLFRYISNLARDLDPMYPDILVNCEGDRAVEYGGIEAMWLLHHGSLTPMLRATIL